VVAQAEALDFAGGAAFTLAAFNSSFLSNQDTIQTSGRNWFYNCYVEGNVDFIWGSADAALFENCSLRFVNDLGGAAATYSLFVARTGTTIAAGANGAVGKGYVLLNSTVSVDANVTAFFGRDAGSGTFYDQAALINVAFAGLNLATAVTAANTAATIASQATEYDSRDHILNRVVAVTAGVPSGFQAAATSWDVSALATAWGALP
jgi:pectin methylesterase-like acyl-CoA thioesterase